MGKWILGLLAGIGLLIRDFLSRRTEERLTAERNAALVNAEEAKIREQGKTHEVTVLKDLQKKNAALDALDGDDLLDELNDRNK